MNKDKIRELRNGINRGDQILKDNVRIYNGVFTIEDLNKYNIPDRVMMLNKYQKWLKIQRRK